MGKQARRAMHTQGETSRTQRLEGLLYTARSQLEQAIEDTSTARVRLYDVAGQLHAEGVSWRKLAELTGVSHVALQQGFQRVCEAQLREMGL